jgi:hypothetical protein
MIFLGLIGALPTRLLTAQLRLYYPEVSERADPPSDN